MSIFKDRYLGKKIGRLTFQKFLGPEKYLSGVKYWYLVKCDCGKEFQMHRAQVKTSRELCCKDCKVPIIPLNNSTREARLGEFKSIAGLVRSNRKSVGISQGTLSTRLGFKNGQFISNIERGLCSIPFRDIEPLSRELKIDKALIIEAMITDYKNRLINGNIE